MDLHKTVKLKNQRKFIEEGDKIMALCKDARNIKEGDILCTQRRGPSMVSFSKAVRFIGSLVLAVSLTLICCSSAQAVPAPTLTVTNGCVSGGSGSVKATVTAGFSTCSGQAGWVEDLWDSMKECTSSADGSATCTATLDCAVLQGTNTFTATATDCTGTGTATPQTLIIDNTPSVTVTSPSGTLQGPFDITGTATFAPTLQTLQGTITAYVNGNPQWHSTLNCNNNGPNKGVPCVYSYKAVSGVLDDLNNGGPYTVYLKASSSNALHPINVSSNTLTFSENKTPAISLTVPSTFQPPPAVNTLSGPFDITGTAVFQPSLNSTLGWMGGYINGLALPQQTFTESQCTYANNSYQCTYDFQTLNKGLPYDLDTSLPNTHYTLLLFAAVPNAVTYTPTYQFTENKIPIVTIISPLSTFSGSADVKGTVVFAPTLNTNLGWITAYVNGQTISNQAYPANSCTSSTCPLNYDFSSYNFLPGYNYTVEVCGVVPYWNGTLLYNCQTLSAKDETCNLSVTPLASTKTVIDPSAGGATLLSASLTGANNGDPVSWFLTVAGQQFTGTGSSVSVSWDGKDSSGYPVSPGSYPATITFSTVPGCSIPTSASVTVTADPLAASTTSRETCPYVSLGSSANVMSGNLYHSQTLFTVPNSKLMDQFVLSYNSLDGRNMPLGTGWTHTYNITVSANNNGTYTVTEGDGTKTVYYFNGSYYTPKTSAYPILTMNGNGATLQYKDGTSYAFNSAGEITSLSDRNSNALTLTYTSGHLSEIADPSGRTVSFTYNAGSRISTITDPGGNIHTFTYSGSTLSGVSSQITGLGTRASSYTYDGSGFMLSKTEADGFTTTYAYDSTHKVTGSTDPQGRTRAVSYNASFQQTQLTEKDGGLWTFHFDSTVGGLTQKTDPLGNSKSFTYDSNRNLSTVTDQRGYVTAYSYDSLGNVAAITDAIGHIRSYTYNALNKPLTVANPDNTTVGMGYDSRGNLTSVTDQAGAVTQYAYDVSGNLTSVTDALGNITTLSYNPQGYLVSITEPTGAVTTLGYDSAGNMISVTDALGHLAQYQYNGLGKVTQITDPEGHATLFAYDLNGNTASVTDGNGNTMSYTYNYQGQVASVTDAVSTVTTLTYGGTGCPSCGSGVDKLTALTDAKGNTTNFLYDTVGRLTRQTNPTGSYKAYTYDAAGNLSSMTDENGNSTSYTYDALNRLIQESFPGGTAKTFGYDAMGRMVNGGNQNLSYTIVYDVAGRLLSVLDSVGRTSAYLHDALGRRTQMTTPDGRIITYGYDAGSRLSQISAGTDVFGYSYDLQGRRTALDFPNGVSTTYSYSAASNLTGINITISQQTLINQFLYTCDNTRNKTSLADLAGLHSYTYDPIYQLTQATHPSPDPTEQYAYDPVGNRTGTTVTANNSLLEDSLFTYAYDGNGNLTSKTEKATGIVTTYAWDYENRLVSVTSASLSAQYQYDPFGRRIQKTVNGVTSRYAYDGPNIVTQYDGNSNLTAGYVHNLAIDDPLSVTQTAGSFYYHKDSLGTVTDLTDSTGLTVQAYDFDSFGNIVGISGSLTQPFTFTGREYDPETGLYFYRARYYDAKAGRFISRDPIGFAGGINQYRMVSNNPLNFTDPLGLDPNNPTTGTVNEVLRCHVNPHQDPVENAVGGAIIISAASLPLLTEAGAVIIPTTEGFIIKNLDKVMPYLNALFDKVINYNPGQPSGYDLIKNGVNTLSNKSKGQSCPQDSEKTFQCHKGY